MVTASQWWRHHTLSYVKLREATVGRRARNVNSFRKLFMNAAASAAFP
jgi:hypothetical protein